MERLARQLLDRLVGLGAITDEQATRCFERIPHEAERPQEAFAAWIERLREEGVDEQALAVIDLGRFCGRRIGGFEIGTPLGVGGMGAVFEAVQLSLSRRVAVKILDRQLALRPTFLERFRREARAAARLQHRHVVQPIDFGEENGVFYFAMEYMAGGSVRDRIEREGPLAVRDALEIARAVADALVYAAEQGIVHRDIKPHNILFDAHGEVKLADLGLALDLRQGGTRLTSEAVILGSPHYVSPEQVLGDAPTDVRSDIYALGITLYEMLTGAPPFDGPSPTAVFTKHVSAPLPSLVERLPDLAPAVRALIERMCAKRPESRFQDAMSLRERLDALLSTPALLAPLSRAPVRAPESESEPVEPAEPASEAEPESAPECEHLEKPPPELPSEEAGVAASARAAPLWRRRAWVVGAVSLLAAAAIGLGAWFGRSGSRDRAAAALLDPQAEHEAAKRLASLLWSKQRADGAFGSYTFASDPWTSAEALRALALFESWRQRHGKSAAADRKAATKRLEALVGRLLTMDVGRRATWGGPGFAGYPLTVDYDTLGFTEASADVGFALALAAGRVPNDVRPRAAEILAWLLANQNADGSWSTLPVLGEQAAMTAASALALHAVCLLVELLGPEHEAARGAGDAIGRASGWLTSMFNARPVPSFELNPRRRTGADRHLSGLNERCVLALFEALELERRGRTTLPASVEQTLELWEEHDPLRLPGVDEVVGARPEDYLFVRSLESPHRSSVTGYRWLVWPWRLFMARAFASWERSRRKAEWRDHARALAAALPKIPETARELDTWQIADYTFGAAVLLESERLAREQGENEPVRFVDLLLGESERR